MRCHYEVLAVERDASAKDVKKAFHVQALRWHPDKHQKNNISSEEATLRFQEIQSAYEVLSDAHERKWYDDHREQILRGDDGTGGDSDGGEGVGDGLNLFRYFSPSVYSGFGADEKSFYSVYGALFKKIDEMDIEAVATSSNVPQEAPAFGDTRMSMDEVNAFYQHWLSYISQRTFAWVDEYRTLDAPSRQIRRAMEKENKKLRDTAKRAFTTEVRELVEFVRRRDQRMIAFLKQREKEKAQQKKDEELKKKEKQAAYEAEKLAFQQQERERWEAMEGDQQTSRLAQNAIDEELAKMRKKMDADLLLCDLCRKTFKSPKQLQSHLVSKKHRDMEVELGIAGVGSDYNSLEAELDRELQAELAAARKNGTLKSKSLEEEEEEAGNAGQGEGDDQEDEAERREQEAEAARVAEEARLLKEQKAAEKRKERKEQRKQQKKEGVEKLTSGKNAKDKDSGSKTAKDGANNGAVDAFSDSEEEGGKRGSRRKGAKGKKR